MKKIRTIQVLFFFTGISFTNLQAQQAVSASGGDATGAGGTVAYSIGQVAYTSNSASSGSSNQGVQQPYEFYTIGINVLKNINLETSVYPNPALSGVILKIENQETAHLSFRLFDLNGKLLVDKKITGNETRIPLESLADGLYFLNVFNQQTEIKSFKIIKNN